MGGAAVVVGGAAVDVGDSVEDMASVVLSGGLVELSVVWVDVVGGDSVVLVVVIGSSKKGGGISWPETLLINTSTNTTKKIMSLKESIFSVFQNKLRDEFCVFLRFFS